MAGVGVADPGGAVVAVAAAAVAVVPVVVVVAGSSADIPHSPGRNGSTPEKDAPFVEEAREKYCQDYGGHPLEQLGVISRRFRYDAADKVACHLVIVDELSGHVEGDRVGSDPEEDWGPPAPTPNVDHPVERAQEETAIPCSEHNEGRRPELFHDPAV